MVKCLVEDFCSLIWQNLSIWQQKSKKTVPFKEAAIKLFLISIQFKNEEIDFWTRMHNFHTWHFYLKSYRVNMRLQMFLLTQHLCLFNWIKIYLQMITQSESDTDHTFNRVRRISRFRTTSFAKRHCQILRNIQ